MQDLTLNVVRMPGFFGLKKITKKRMRLRGLLISIQLKMSLTLSGMRPTKIGWDKIKQSAALSVRAAFQ